MKIPKYNQESILSASFPRVSAGPTNKKSFGEKRRIRLEARDGDTCWLCGYPFEPTGPLRKTIDHIIPRVQGGSHSMRNLRLAHKLCNQLRGSRRPGDPRIDGAIRKALMTYWKSVMDSL